jgi:hypothetical protein
VLYLGKDIWERPMSNAQSIPRGRRRLRNIDDELCRSDPAFAAMFAAFARLNADEAMPGWEQVRIPPSLGWRVLLWPIAALAFLLVYAAGGGASAARGAAVACGARRRALGDGRAVPSAGQVTRRG